MKDIDNLNAFASYAVQKFYWVFQRVHECRVVHSDPPHGQDEERRQLIVALHDRTVGGLLGFGEDKAMDVGERS
jgi:hypothetical protein